MKEKIKLNYFACKECNIVLKIMKISFFTIFLCVFSIAAENIYSQQTEVSLNLKNVTLKKAISEIEKASDYVFLVSDEAKAELNNTASIEVNKASIQNILENLLNNTNLGYKITERQVSIYKSEKPKPIIVEVAKVAEPTQQKKKTTGRVVDEQGEPIIGANIMEKGTSNGTVTDADGNFTLNVENNAVLTISYIGYVSQDIKTSGKSTFNITLVEDTQALEEVVVTGYQTISKERATGAYNMIKTDQIEKPATNIGQRIVGTSSGVQTTLDVDGNVKFEIRGQTSLLASAQPLVVVDGFPIQGDLNSINPNDIANITILKDAAAASIWGARSANGVIVITSKSGKAKGKGVKVDFNAFMKFSPKIDMNYLNSYATSAEVIDYERRGFKSNFFGGPWAPKPDSNTDLTGGYSLAVMAMNEHRLGYISQNELDNILANLSTKDNRQQIKDNMLQNPFSQQYSLNVSTSNDRSSNILSLLYEDKKTNYMGNAGAKYNIGYRTQTKLFDWLDFNFSGTFVMDDSKNNGSGYSSSPYNMLLNEDGSRTALPNTYYWPNIERHVPYENFPYSDWSYNPITEIKNRNNRTKTLNARVQGGLTLRIIEGLTFDTKIQYELLNSSTKDIRTDESFFVRSLINNASTWNRATGKVTANLPKGGILDQNRNERTAYNWRNQLNFNREFNDKHMVSFIAGTEMSEVVYQYYENPRSYGYDDNKLSVSGFPNGVGGSGNLAIRNWLGNTISFAHTNKFSYSTDRYVSMYANASYTFDRKYTVSGSARTDASNLITDDPKYRYSPFWSVGASWALSNEDFMKDIDWADRLTVRATYGYNGNVDKSTSFMPLISIPGTQDNYIHDFTAAISSYGNPSLRWEKTGTIDFGVDFSLLRGKLHGKLDLYNKKGRDLIVSMSIPAVNGTSSQKLNMAEMTNRGIELELGTNANIYGRDITWNGSINLSYNYNNIDDLFKVTYPASDLYAGDTKSYVQGHNANALWSFEYAGVVNKGSEANPNWQPVVQGKGDEVYDFGGWTPGDGRDYMLDMGTKIAPYTLGFINNFKIYDFDLSFIITGKFGHVFNAQTFNYPSMSGGSALPNNLYNEILNSDPMQRVPIPFGKSEPRYYFWDRFYPYLDYRVQNAGHIRFQELNLTYNIKKELLHKIGLSSARIYGQANNLFVISNNRYNEDPEFPIGTLKPQPTITLGVNVSF